MPRGVTIESSDDESTAAGTYRSGPRPRSAKIVRRWFSGRAIATALAALVWGGATTPIALSLIDEMGRGGGSYLGALVALFFAGTAALSYAALQQAVNRTVIEMRDGVLSIEHGPLPGLRGKRLPAAEIDSVAVVGRRLPGTVDVSEMDGVGGKLTYAVHAEMKNGAPVPLIENLDSRAQAELIQQELARFGEIEPVRLETPPEHNEEDVVEVEAEHSAENEKQAR